MFTPLNGSIIFQLPGDQDKASFKAFDSWKKIGDSHLASRDEVRPKIHFQDILIQHQISENNRVISGWLAQEQGRAGPRGCQTHKLTITPLIPNTPQLRPAGKSERDPL